MDTLSISSVPAIQTNAVCSSTGTVPKMHTGMSLTHPAFILSEQTYPCNKA